MGEQARVRPAKPPVNSLSLVLRFFWLGKAQASSCSVWEMGWLQGLGEWRMEEEYLLWKLETCYMKTGHY